MRRVILFGFGIGIISFFIVIFFLNYLEMPEREISYLILLLGYLLYIIFPFSRDPSQNQLIIIWLMIMITSAIVWGILGSLIGLIIGYLRKEIKKQSYDQI